MTTHRVPLNAPTFDQREIDAACEVLRSGFVTMGAQCSRFEREFAEYLGVGHAVFVNSGSSANLLAFFALANHALPLTGGKRRMDPGDEVIVPAVTWSTTIWPIVQAGGVPVLVDCDPATLQLDTAAAARAVTDKTVAICPVHVLGNAVPMAPILDLAREHDLWVVEDTCEALGTRNAGRFVGTFGDLASFSFFFSHHITTIEGGMITTNERPLAELLRVQRSHGWTRHLQDRGAVEAAYPDLDPQYLFVNSGFNLRPTEINAAFGLCQLPKLEGFNRRRVEVARAWCSAFERLTREGLLTPMQITESTDPTWFGFPVLCRDQTLRNRLREHLAAKGIETRPIICGNMARQPAFRNIRHRISGPLTGADRVMDCGIYWGAHPAMTDGEVAYVAETVTRFFEQ